jgi:predicted RNase H-like nuclease (RuvC/YqgF family)
MKSLFISSLFILAFSFFSFAEETPVTPPPEVSEETFAEKASSDIAVSAFSDLVSELSTLQSEIFRLEDRLEDKLTRFKKNTEENLKMIHGMQKEISILEEKFLAHLDVASKLQADFEEVGEMC